jgi:hypothetical protein
VIPTATFLLKKESSDSEMIVYVENEGHFLEAACFPFPFVKFSVLSLRFACCFGFKFGKLSQKATPLVRLFKVKKDIFSYVPII